MKLRQRIGRWIAKQLWGVQWGTPPADTWEFAQNWIRGHASHKQETGPYGSVGPYQRVVSVISRDAAAVPWEFYRTDSRGNVQDEPIENHPVEMIWKHPNEFLFGNQLFVGSYISKLIFGEWIWYYPDLQVGRSGGLRASMQSTGEIQLLHPGNVKREMTKAGEPVYWIEDPSGGTRTFLDREKLTISRRYNPYDPLYGMPLSVSIAAVMLGYKAAAEWNARFFNENNGVPTLVLTPGAASGIGPGGDRDRIKEVLRSWSQRHGRKRSVGMLPGPDWSIQDFGTSQRDMDFDGLQQFGRDEILAAGGVPPLIAGYLTRSVTYNASEQKELYWDSTIRQFLTEETSVINGDFLPKVGVTDRVYPNWEVVAALLENLGEKTEVAKEWFAMGINKRTINERLEMGWDADQIPDYDQGYLPFNLIPVEAMGRQPQLAPPPAETDTDDDTDNGEQRGYSIAGQDEQRRALVWRQIQTQTRDLELRFNKTIRKYFKDLERVALERLTGLRSFAGGGGDPRAWVFAVVKQEDDLFDSDEAKQELVKRTRPGHEAGMKRGGEGVIMEAGVSIGFDLEDPYVLAKLTELSFKITTIVDTLEGALRASLAEGLQAQETIDQLAARVSHEFDVSLGRSMTIARTEIGKSYNTGRDAGMRQAGIEMQEWLSSRDPDVRDTHVAVDGEQISLGANFSNGIKYPLDPAGPAGEVINCRCVAVPVVGD